MNMNKLRSLVFAAFLALPFASSFAQVGISVNWAPPPLPVYEQPLCPVAGYIWTPGYWGWDSYYYDYYWVPGVWVPPPRVGLLWTPGWWGWRNGAYAFNQGYWGPTVGFYGGVNYGFGYTGNGYWGGRWSGNTFQYNTAVTRVNKTVIRNTYVNNSFTRNVNANRTSFNGPNGIKAEPTAQQRAAAANANKVGPTSQQLSRQQAASKDQNLRASVNKGKPNQEAIKSFNRAERTGQGKGAQEVGAAGGAAGAGADKKAGDLAERQGQGAAAGAGAGQGENKPGNMAERNREGAGADEVQGGKRPGTESGLGAEKAENNRANMAERNRQGAGAGKPGANANKLKTENQRNRQNMGGNQAKMHTGNAAAARGQHAMNQQKPKQMSGQHRQQQMGGGQYQQQKMAAQRRPQMQGGGNRPPPRGKQQQQQQQKKKKPNER
jgi:hypothetical protein